MIRWFYALSLLIVTVSALYKCGEDRTCSGKDTCCNVKSFFNVCCPQKSTCCANKNKAKCCGPLDTCCSNPKYRGIACCPHNYRCCGAGRYGGLRNTCCYQVPVWLWVIMGLSLSLILLMLLLSLVECILEERQATTERSGSYNASYYGGQYHDYGTYPAYNTGNLYNDPVPPQSSYTTPPPNYSATPPPGYEESNSGSGDGTRQRGVQEGNSAIGDGTRQENGSPVEESVSVSEDVVIEEEVAVDTPQNSTPPEQNEEVREVHSPMGNMWEKYLRRSLSRKGKKNKQSRDTDQEQHSASTSDLLGASSSRVTVDSGIVDSDDGSDEISSIHWSSWEDDVELDLGRQVVYELKPLDTTATVPRLQTIIDKQTNKRTDNSIDKQTNKRTDNISVVSCSNSQQ